MQLLHVIATPRGSKSNTLVVAEAFVEFLRETRPELQVATRDLFAEDLPSVAGENIESKYTLMHGQAIAPSHADSWKEIEALIHQFMAADVVLVSAPMWNFSIPYVLKYYIDCIVQPGYLFKFSDQGVPVGMCAGKRLVCVTTRGGDFSEGGPMHAYDLQEPYLRTIFGFVGIADQEYLHAQPMDVTPELREAALTTAVNSARRLALTPAAV